MAEEKTRGSGGATAPIAKTEMEQLRALLREYGQPALIGIGLAVAVLLGFGAYRTWRQNNVMKAAQLLSRAGSVEQLQQIVSQYGSTPSAPLALLVLAARHFDAGQFEMAQYAYAQFEQKFPKHPMKTAAEVGRAQCLEARGQWDQALQAIDAFLAKHPEDYMAPLARLSRARVLAQVDRLEDARAAYEDFITAHPDSGWVPMAENALEQVNRQLRERTGAGASGKSPPVTAPGGTARPPPEAPSPGPVPEAASPAR